MKITRRILGLVLSFAGVSLSLPQQAIAQVIAIGGAAAGAPGVTGVIPKIELGTAFSLSPSPLLVPSLSGGLIPALNAPLIVIPQSVNPSAELPEGERAQQRQQEK